MQPVFPNPENVDEGSSEQERAGVTLYSVNGLHEEPTNWLGKLMPEFTTKTGIRIGYTEDHSRAIVKRASVPDGAPRPDVLITLSPFIQMAARDGLLAPYRPEGKDPADAGPDDHHLLIRNYPNLICHGGPGAAVPATWTDLLKPTFRGKIQYSKPGWSGAGTALLLQVCRAFGGRAAGLDYLRELQRNCLPPTAHTQGLAPLVDTGDLFVANGDLQTNYPQCAEYPNLRLVIPAAPDGKRYVYEFSYYIALLKDAPNPKAGKALIDFLYGERAQSMICDVVKGLPGRRNVAQSGGTYRALTKILQGVEIWEPDWREVIATLDGDVEAYERTVLERETR